MSSVFLRSQIIITEIIYDLVGSESPNEFVELFNISDSDTIDLTGWQIRDKSSSDALVDSGWGLILLPMQYGIIFEGDYIFQNGIYADHLPNDAVLIKVACTTIGNNLNNAGGDSLYLINTDGLIADSVGYDNIAQEGILSWNWKRKNGEPVRIGIYIIKFTAKNPATGKIWEDVQTIVLAKKL